MKVVDVLARVEIIQGFQIKSIEIYHLAQQKMSLAMRTNFFRSGSQLTLLNSQVFNLTVLV